MPKFLEDKLKKEYGANSKVPYKVMNSIGAMHGSKETAKGRAMDKKHAADKGEAMNNGYSTEVRSAVAPAPKASRELVHIEAAPHRGGVKVSAKFREGGSMEKMEKHVPDMAAAHAEMGKHMMSEAEPKESEEHEEE